MTKRKPLSSMLAEDFSDEEKAFLDGINLPEKRETSLIETQPKSEEPKTPVSASPQTLAAKASPSKLRKERRVEAKSNNSDLVARLKAPEKERMTRFTADLNETLHKKLSAVAYKSGCTKVEVVRMILEDALKDFDV